MFTINFLFAGKTTTCNVVVKTSMEFQGGGVILKYLFKFWRHNCLEEMFPENVSVSYKHNVSIHIIITNTRMYIVDIAMIVYIVFYKSDSFVCVCLLFLLRLLY